VRTAVKGHVSQEESRAEGVTRLLRRMRAAISEGSGRQEGVPVGDIVRYAWQTVRAVVPPELVLATVGVIGVLLLGKMRRQS